MAAAMKDNAYEVSDPTDWQGTPLAGLTQVEQSLRCHVCKDFFNSPMITTCCHTFCSLCIRRALSTDSKCPLCRGVDQESKLRANIAIREAVEAFTVSRDATLRLARQTMAGGSTTTPKRKADDEATDEAAPKRTRMSTRSSSARASKATAAMMEEEADIPETKEEDAYVPPNDGLVGCPICEWRMEAHKVDRHLDTDCPGEVRPQPIPPKPKTFKFSTARPATNTTATTTNERLPLLNFALLNETKFRRKLNDIGIPAHGTKQNMEKRYKEWAMMWNANCDSNRPKSMQELLRDLDVWERTQGSLAPTSSHAANLGAQIKDKNFDGAGWAAKHSNSFKDLIASARKSQQAKMVTMPNPSEEEAHTIDTPVTSTPVSGETTENMDVDTNEAEGKPLPILSGRRETVPVESSVTIDLTSRSMEQTNLGGMPPG